MAENRVVKTHTTVGFGQMIGDIKDLEAAMCMSHQEARHVFAVFLQDFAMKFELIFDQLVIALVEARLPLAVSMPSLIHSQEVKPLARKFLRQVSIPSSVIMLPMDEKYKTFLAGGRIPVSLNLDLLIAFHHVEVL
jgi:hypothetical protein